MKTRTLAWFSVASLGLIAAISLLWPTPSVSSNAADVRAVETKSVVSSTIDPDASAPVVAIARGGDAETVVPSAIGARVNDASRPVLPQPDFTKIEAFEGWITNWQKASPEERASMASEGARLAAARRAEFKALIATNPRLAMERAVPRVVRQDLPAAIVSELEQPVSTTGDYSVYLGLPAPGSPAPARPLENRIFETRDGERYETYVFGDLQTVMWKKQMPLQGVAVDHVLAAAENPVRRLEVGERIPPGKVVEEICPVSGKKTETTASGEPVAADEPTVEIAERLITLCEPQHVTALEDQYRTLYQASGPGGANVFLENFPGTSSMAIGNFRILYIRLAYPDQPEAPNTEEQAYQDLQGLERFWLESSYGKLTVTPSVTPLVMLPRSKAWYMMRESLGPYQVGMSAVHDDARNEARKLGYDSTQFDCTIVRVKGGPAMEGASYGGPGKVWLTWNGMDVMNHECGHALGLNHADFWETTDGTAYGNPLISGGKIGHYGNAFDVMGGASGYSGQYNTIGKRLLGWLPDAYVHYPTTNGVFRIHAYDQPRLEEGKRYSLVVAKDSLRKYNIEYHPARGGLLADSALVLYSGGPSNTGHLLDTTPGSPAGKADGGIAIGRTYSDPESDQHFTVLAKNATSPPSLDVAYYRGPFPGNNAPTLALDASATNIVAGGSATFTAIANDADGDALAYHWDFNDGVTASNSAVVTRSFPTVAQVTAMLTVSDMKGGTVRRHVVINVGAHGRQTVTGNVTWNDQPLQNVKVSSGTKYAYTDADGNYALSGLNTGANALTATLTGFTFTPDFSNPLNVVAGANTADWTASNSTFVTLTKTADATEGGANGSFTLTRTGDTTAALKVRVSPVGGTATKTTDYTFNPDYAADNSIYGSHFSFTIPAGQASLAVAVAAVNDAAQEGVETITLQLASNGTYFSNSVNSVVMSIHDNDTALPQVAVVANDPYAAELPADPGSFKFTRTGSTAAALNLSVTWTGTATNGEDVTALPAVVTIPAEQSSVTVAVNPLDDALIEVPESVIATINTNAAYVRGAETTATVTLTDDDTPVVTVSVPDASASEAGPDSGIFLIQRSGSTAAPLKVYYGLSGSALHGTDYAPLKGEVIIPAGASSAPVVISPYDDDVGELDETVVLAVASFNNDYSLGSAFQGTVTISDNADLPVVSVRTGVVGAEGGVNPTFIIRAVGGGAGNVTVNYTVSGSATSGIDFGALAGSVSIPAFGMNDVTVTVPVNDDVAAEPTEGVIVTITPDPAYKIYNDASAETVILDNDSGGERVRVSTWNHSPSESGTIGNFYFSRIGSVGDLAVNYIVSGTATNGADYVNLPGTVVIPNGQTGANVTITPVNDADVEGTETVTLTVVAGIGYSPDRPTAATFEIIDSESPPITVGFETQSSTTSEIPGANGEYRDLPVTLSAASASTITVQVVGGTGTSASGDDVDWAFVDAENGNAVIPTATLTFAPGVTNRNVRIRVKNDGAVEQGEIAVLELRAPLAASLSPTHAKHQLWIFDQAIPSLYNEERWSGSAVYTNQSWNGSVPNYVGNLNSFTPAQGVGDNFSRRITGQIVAPATGTYTFWIASDDASRLYLSADSTAANKVQIASLAAATDFQNWEANATQRSANINLVAGQSYYMEVQHQEINGGDHVSVAWEGPGFTRRPITIPVPDETPRTVGMLATATTRTEADDSEPLLQVVLDRPAGSAPITVNYSASGTATAGSDYALAAGALTFLAGEQMKPLPLVILADAVVEAPEAIVVTLSDPVGAQIGSSPSHIITLHDAATPAVGTLFFTAASTMGSGTVLGNLIATPAPGRNITDWQIVAGNTGNAFALDAAGQLTLATPGALPNPGGMQLVVRAIDGLGASGDGLVNVICNGPANGVVEQRWVGGSNYSTEQWIGAPVYTGTLASFTSAQNVGDGFSRRLTGYLKPQVSGDYTFWIAGDEDCRLYLSSDGSPSNTRKIAESAGWTAAQEWDKRPVQKSVIIPLVAGKVYWLEVHNLEGSGIDHVSVAWQGPGIARQAIPSAVIFPNVVGVDFENPPVVPTIALTSPVNGAEFHSGDNVTLEASVAGGSIAVSSVEFYRGATLIGSDNTAPYSVIWNNATVGNHVLTAKATYNGGGVTSFAVVVSVRDLDPASDPDGDGFTTGLELALGTDPHSASSQPSSLYANLRAWWKLDESSGTTAGDSTGRAQNGTVSGAAWSNGIADGGLTFDGTDDGVLVGTSAAVTGTTDFSLAAWVKVDPGSPTGTVIQQREPGATGYQGEYMLNVNANGTVNFFVYGTSTYQFNLTTTAAINDGQWHHLAAVRSGTGGKVYIDGVEAANGGGTIQALQSRAVSIGYDYRDSNKRFDGSLDDVRIYERALSVGEIDGLHDALVPNRAPAFTADPVVKAAATEDGAYNGSLAGDAGDPDFGDALTYSKVSGPAWLTVAANGALSGTPENGNVGANNFTVRVTDPAGLSDDAVLSILVNNVNDAPVFAADPVNLNAIEDSAFAGQLAASDADAGDTRTYSKVSGPAWLAVSATGALTGTPLNDNVGANAFVVRVTDGSGAFDQAALSVTVANTNDAPVFTTDPINLNATEDSAFAGQLAASDADAGDTRTYSKVSGPAWLAVSSSGALTGTPLNANVGVNAFVVRVTDGSGAFDEAALNVTVANVNDAPVFTVDPILAADVPVGTAYTGQTLAGSATDADAGDIITYSKVTGPAWLSVAANGALTGTPPSGNAGLNTFVVRATDSSSATDDAELRINVTGLPLPWTNVDIGTGMLAGSASHSSGTFTLTGSGALGGSSDKLQFTYQTLTGDGEITARVSSLQNTGTSSRVGVMMRDTLAANSRQAFFGLSGTGDYRWERRYSGTNVSFASGSGIVPNTWVKLTRVGSVITAYKSSDGITWTQVTSGTVSMASNCYIGLAVSSGSNTTVNTSQFSDISVTP